MRATTSNVDCLSHTILLDHAYFSFSEDVYLVKGASRHCIYDLKNGYLYAISALAKDVSDALHTKPYAYKDLSDEAKSIADFFLESGLLETSSAPATMQDILTLKREFSPSFSWIEVTRKCNLKCTFCYEESSPDCYEKMDFEDFKLAIKNLKDVGIRNIQFIGGEPMILGDELKKMITYCRQNPTDFDFIEVYTNGVFIQTHWCEFFKEHDIRLALSVHSYIPEEHDKVTLTKGSHARVIRAIDLIQRFEIPYRVGAVQTASCQVGEKTETTSYTIRPDNVRLSGRGAISQYNLDMFKQKAITKDKKRYPITKQQVVQHVSGHQCFMKDLYIGTQLDVFPCVMERRFLYGNLKKESLKKIVQAATTRYLSKDSIDGCKSCEYRYGCFDCRPDANGLGEFQKPWFCSYDPYTGEWSDLEEMFSNLQQGIYHASVYKSSPVLALS